MLHDTITVLAKELKEILYMRNSLKATFSAMLIPVVFIGIFFSVGHGAEWVSSPLSISLWFMIAFIMVSGIIADSFAGERERHTLETLLASRLSEPAILMGKIAAAVIYGLSLAAIGALVSLISVSLTSGEGQFLMFTPGILVTGIATGFLAASTAAAAGVLISLKASSARQAQQMLGFAMMFLFFSPMIIIYLVPDSIIAPLENSLNAMEPLTIGTIAGTVVIALDLVLFVIALFRFKRWKMIVE